MLSRKDYLQRRYEMTSGLLNEGGLQLMYEYWVLSRKDDMLEPDFDTFAQTFSQYLGIGNNYINALDHVLDYFDALYSVGTVSTVKEPNKIIAIV